MTIGEAKFHIKRLLHGAKEASIGDIDYLIERAGNTMLTKIDPISTIRVSALSNLVHDDVYNYALASDFKKPIDLFPQDNRDSEDYVNRRFAEDFDLLKEIEEKRVSIESNDGTKYLRLNWRSRGGKVLNSLNDVDDNGTWIAHGSATGVAQDTIFKVSGSGSLKFNLVATGDGIQNTTMTQVDLTDEDEVADVFVWVYLPSVPTSITARWGNDLTTNYWTSTAQTTQADGASFRVGWNLIKFSWSSATETGTVSPSTIDSFRITVANTTAISGIRVDNIVFSIGRPFDIKYYSKYFIKNTSGTWLSRTTNDNDILVFDTDESQIFLLECLNAAAQQIESENSTFDVTWARTELGDPSIGTGLYGKYQTEHPSQSKKPKTQWYKAYRR